LTKATSTDLNSLLRAAQSQLPPDLFGILSSLMAWADLWDAIHSREVVDINDAMITALISPFTGFGPLKSWETVQPGVTFLVMNKIQQFIADEQNATPMAESIIMEVAPALAAIASGPKAYMAMWKTFRDLTG